MIPYGYQVTNGETIVDQEKKDRILTLFDSYLAGLSMVKAAGEAGISRGIAGRILENPVYLGTEIYPAIVSEEDFYEAQEIRKKRDTHRPGQTKLHRKELEVEKKFNLEIHSFPPMTGKAEWLYQQIKPSSKGKGKASSEEREALRKEFEL